MGRQLAEVLGVDPGLVIPSLRSQAPTVEPRAQDVSLDSGKFRGWFPELAGRGYREALERLAGA
jgi:hypothetical protein